MLSQIESGTALPSVKTLQYLSKVLEVPMAQLMPEEEASADGAAEYMQARELYTQGKFALLTEQPDIAGFTDEVAALRARAYLELAKKQQDGDPSQLQAAADNAKRAAAYAERGIFSNPTVKTEALLLLNSIATRLSDYYKSLITGELEEIKL